MINFESDYTEGCIPEILEALARTNNEQTSGYGEDPHCDNARDLIRKACHAPQAEVQFLVGGTQANATVIAHTLKPYQGAMLTAATSTAMKPEQLKRLDTSALQFLPKTAKSTRKK